MGITDVRNNFHTEDYLQECELTLKTYFNTNII